MACGPSIVVVEHNRFTCTLCQADLGECTDGKVFINVVTPQHSKSLKRSASEPIPTTLQNRQTRPRYGTLYHVPCTDCQNQYVDVNYTTGDVTCVNCGLVLEHHLIDDRAEWKNYDDGEPDKSRVGSSILLESYVSGSKVAPQSLVISAASNRRSCSDELRNAQAAVCRANIRSQCGGGGAAGAAAAGGGTTELAQEMRDLKRVMESLNYTNAMCDLAYTIYHDFNTDVSRVTGDHNKSALCAACASIASGVNNQKGERRCLQETAVEFGADPNIAKKFVNKIRFGLGCNKPYSQVLMIQTNVDDRLNAFTNQVFLLMHDELPNDQLMAVKQVARCISECIGNKISGSADRICFGKTIVFIAIISVTSRLHDTTFEKRLCESLEVCLSTIKKHRLTISRALDAYQQRHGVQFKAMVANIKDKCARISVQQRSK